ncbi:MAG TPA: hypothetical protein VGG48_19770 [Rhizomicrobium sp.]|jgi:hypothetical protein
MHKNVKAGLAVGILGTAMAVGVFIGQALANQPHMEAALSDLRAARSELEQAEHNKMGHRAEAMRLTNEAIRETEAGMEDAH